MIIIIIIKYFRQYTIFYNIPYFYKNKKNIKITKIYNNIIYNSWGGVVGCGVDDVCFPSSRVFVTSFIIEYYISTSSSVAAESREHQQLKLYRYQAQRAFGSQHSFPAQGAGTALT